MSEPTPDKSIQSYVRTGGALYLYIIFAGIFAQVFVRSQLIVSGDAASTATNILASELLFRVGFAVELLMLICDIALALIFFIVLKSVSFRIALLAAFLRVAMAAISGVNSLNHMDALLWLNSITGIESLGIGAVQAMAYHSLMVHAFGYHIALVFFGFYCILLGTLIFRSGFLPKVLGSLMGIAGLCYLVNSFGAILAVDAVMNFGPAILLPALVAELSLASWMLIKGIDIEKWSAQQNL